jgi:salicylate hydroxylase
LKNGGHSGTIAIAGAGIAGLSAAIALKLAGFQAEIFEREAKLEPIGAGIQLGPNATRILDGWNLLPFAASFEPEAIELRNGRTGTLLNTIPLGGAARARYGAPYITLLRADLQAALFSRAAELGIAIKFGCPMTRLNQATQSIEIEAGSESLNVAALIGADGLNSTVRRLSGSNARPFPAHAVAWRAILPLGAVPAPLRGTIAIWMSPGAHLVHYPVSEGACLNAVLVIDDGPGTKSNSAAAALPFLLDRLSGWAELPRRAIASVEAWQAWRMCGLEKSTGGEGRIQLIGDAWHAMRPYLASGAVMAIEDADALAASLTGTETDIELGLKLFRQRRGPRVWRVAWASALMGRVYHCPPPFDAIRDLAIGTPPGPMLLARNDWLYGPRP